MKVLIIAPHPDDEVLGCGGVIKKHRDRADEVYVCYGTKAYGPDWSEEFLKLRPKEIEHAGRILSITKAYFLDFLTVQVDTVPQKERNEALAKVVDDVKPNIVYLPHQGDLNSDHRLFFEAGLVVCRMKPQSTIKKILSYEVLSETEWGRAIKEFVPNVHVDITKEMETKVEAMKAYGSEIRGFPHPRSLEAMDALAKKRGSEVGVAYAEAFVLIQELA